MNYTQYYDTESKRRYNLRQLAAEGKSPDDLNIAVLLRPEPEYDPMYQYISDTGEADLGPDDKWYVRFEVKNRDKGAVLEYFRQRFYRAVKLHASEAITYNQNIVFSAYHISMPLMESLKQNHNKGIGFTVSSQITLKPFDWSTVGENTINDCYNYLVKYGQKLDQVNAVVDQFLDSEPVDVIGPIVPLDWVKTKFDQLMTQ
jgi:hypothetical protein